MMTEYFDFHLFWTTAATLTVILDPPGTLPVYLALTAPMDKKGRKKAAWQATCVSFVVLLVFGVLGNFILQGLQISMHALQMAGGVLLFIVAFELMTGKSDAPPDAEDSVKPNIAMVPLGTPLLAGPGAIVAVMVAVQGGHSQPQGAISLLAAMLVAHAVMWLFMHFAEIIRRVLGVSGTMFATRIAGLLLAAIAMQMVVDAIFTFAKCYGL